MLDSDRIVPSDNAAGTSSEIRIECGVLGPLLITVDGTELAVTSPRSRTFVAQLVLGVGRQVTLFEFADAMWGDMLPKNPRRAVQLCAVRVRAQLERVGAGDIVVTCPDGYRLDLPPEHTDVGRLKSLLREADNAADTDSDAELAALTEALGLWRGEPLADVPSELLQREIAPGLREQQLQLAERHIDIRLRSGNAVDLVDELVTLTARHPLRERLWGQLMQALHRSGRRGEALTAYHRFRRRLGDELGIDPGEAIRALHAAILTSQSEADQDAVRGLPIPRELPSDTAAFAGRASQLAKLDDLLAALDTSTGSVTGVITGTAGVGKTTLAIHWGRRVADEFPDGQLYVNMRGYHPEHALSPQRVLARFLRTLGVRGQDVPDDADELAALYRSTMDGRRMLLLLDNVNNSDQVRPLLPSTPGCLVVITSRDVLLSLIAADSARQISLDLPDTTEARQMLARRLGAKRLNSELSAADAIIAASARLPLALAIAAARAVTNRDSRLSVVAEQLRSGLDAFDTESPMTDVRSVFSWSYRALSPEAARLLRLFGLHPGPDLTALAAASLGGLSPRLATRLLAELVRAHLVTELLPGRYALHDLMREYCVELLCANETDTDRDLAGRRVLDYYVYAGYTAATAINPRWADKVLDEVRAVVDPGHITDNDAAMDWFAAESEVMRTVLAWAHRCGYDLQVWQLVWVLAGYLDRLGSWTQLVGCHQAAIAAAERLGEPILQARSHRGLGLAYSRMSRLDEAHRHYVRALKLYGDNGDLDGQSRTETTLALLCEQQKRYPQALTHAQRALELQSLLDDGAGYANALNAVGWCHTLTGQYRLALDYCRQAIAKHQEIADPIGEAAVLDTIGNVYHHLGQFAEAIDSYRRSIELNRRRGGRFYVGLGLLGLGDAHEAVGDRAAALEVWREAESILDDLGHPAVKQARAKLRGVAANSEMTR